MNKFKLVVIDDEKSLLDIISYFLVRQYPDMEIVCCSDVAYALKELPTANGVLADICLPSSGELNAMLDTLSVPVVRMSAQIDIPGEEVLCKPFKIPALHAVIDKMVEKTRT